MSWLWPLGDDASQEYVTVQGLKGWNALLSAILSVEYLILQTY